MPIRARPAQLALGRVRGPVTPATVFSKTQVRRASDEPPRPPSNEEKSGRSFRGQMMGSIGHRIKRERQELERWSEYQERRSTSSNWGMTFGAWPGSPC
ncbi:MAG: hypothetical protein IMZ46_12880 [Acidobacteria bacterium]|nr:hypothetical protein [Acidobacteriota bacterium]